MSGYFVHGGTQYTYGQQQSAPQATNQSSISGYQHSPQATQFYQNSSYGQQSRGVLSGSTKSAAVGSLYGSSSYGSQSQTLGQSYSSQQRSSQGSHSYSSLDSSSNYGRQSSSDSYSRPSYGSDSTGFGSSSYGLKEEKYSSGNLYGGFKSGGSFGSSGYGNSPSSTSYFSQNSFSTSYPSSSSYGKTEDVSSSQSSYEKALRAAATQYYLNKKTNPPRGGGRGGFGPPGGRGARGGRGRGGGGRGGSLSSTSSGPKVIKATEVKAYLYAWCGQRRLKPEYTIESLGMPPKIKFCCTLVISGLDYTAKVTAASKKDSQSRAAWDFCQHLVKTNYMKESELPEKPVDPAPKSASAPKPSTPAGTDPSDAETIGESGGWTLENCRQRLNQFTQRWRIPAEFKHETHGPEHARTFIAEMSIKIKWLDKEFHARERGNNKKQATAVCALAMIRQLFKEELIEKQGDPIKHPIRRQPNKDSEKKRVQQSTAGTKRKAEENGSEEVDEYGNWKLEDGRQRLHMYCQATNQPFEMKYTPDSNVPPKTFTAEIGIDVTIDGEKIHLDKSHVGPGKKQAAQHCALEMIKELFQRSLVEPNIGPQQSKKKTQRQRGVAGNETFAGPLMEAPFGPPMFHPGPMFAPTFFGGMGPPQRRTPYEDAAIFEKHKRIYPTESELNLIQKTVRTIENSLKEVSDHLSELEAKSEVEKEVGAEGEEKEETKSEKRILQGVMRVGALAKGLLLTGDLNAHLVLLCIEIPTASMLTKISSCLSKTLENSDGEYLVEVHISDCCIDVTSPVETSEGGESVKCAVKISVTSPLMRTIEPATGPADMLDRIKCLQSLAELRHAKWFQACANGLQSCVVLLRIFNDMKKRIATWAPLPDWALELIVEKTLRTSPLGPLSVGEGMRRILSCFSSGIILEDGPGIYDPCEKVAIDVIENMTKQEREDITESAHHALRMIVFRQTHKILGIEPMPARTRKSTDGEQQSAAAVSGMET